MCNKIDIKYEDKYYLYSQTHLLKSDLKQILKMKEFFMSIFGVEDFNMNKSNDDGFNLVMMQI